MTTQTITSNGTLTLPTGPGTLSILATGETASALVVQQSADGSTWATANPLEFETLINRPFFLQTSPNFQYRLNNTNDEGDITVAIENV